MMTKLFFRRFIGFVFPVCLLLLSIWTPTSPAQEPLRPEAFSQRQAERKAMVEALSKSPGRTPIVDRSVINAMLRVPRHSFVPEDYSAFAYHDSPLPIGQGQTISQPYIVALMTQALELRPGMKVLEIGSGSGYQAAILAELTPYVFTVEIIEPLYKSAAARLKNLGYSKTNIKMGDGYYGWKESSPFDAIIVTCAALHIPPPLIEQLAPGGKIIIPVGGAFEVQRLLSVTKDSAGARSSRTLELVRFVPLVRGSSQ